MRLRSAADLGKNPPWGKTFIVIRKNPWPVGKTSNGKNFFEKPITVTYVNLSIFLIFRRRSDVSSSPVVCRLTSALKREAGEFSTSGTLKIMEEQTVLGGLRAVDTLVFQITAPKYSLNSDSSHH